MWIQNDLNLCFCPHKYSWLLPSFLPSFLPFFLPSFSFLFSFFFSFEFWSWYKSVPVVLCRVHAIVEAVTSWRLPRFVFLLLLTLRRWHSSISLAIRAHRHIHLKALQNVFSENPDYRLHFFFVTYYWSEWVKPRENVCCWQRYNHVKDSVPQPDGSSKVFWVLTFSFSQVFAPNPPWRLGIRSLHGTFKY